MTTPAEARATAEAYVAEYRHRSRVAELLEDASDYFARIETEGEFRAGDGFIFVSKTNGDLWHGSVEVFDKIDRMSPVL